MEDIQSKNVLIFANAFEITKFVKLKTHNNFLLYSMQSKGHIHR